MYALKNFEFFFNLFSISNGKSFLIINIKLNKIKKKMFVLT